MACGSDSGRFLAELNTDEAGPCLSIHSRDSGLPAVTTPPTGVVVFSPGPGCADDLSTEAVDASDADGDTPLGHPRLHGRWSARIVDL